MRGMKLAVLSVVLALSGCAKDGIPMYGLDKDGKFVERYTDEDRFRKELKKATMQVNDSTFTALKNTSPDSSGMLRSVVVGLGFSLEGMLGPILTVSVSPKVRFAFSNSQKPIIP